MQAFTEFVEEKQKEIEKITRGYKLGKFKDFTNLVPEDALIWYSFDDDKNCCNFHIVPDKVTKIQYEKKLLSKWLRVKLNDIKELINGSLNLTELRLFLGRNTTSNHKSILAQDNEYEYLLLPFRLWHEGNYVNNSFGKIQFMRYPIADGQINLIKDENEEYKFQMMYPPTDVDGAYVHVSGHCVYNPKGLTITSDPQDIAKSFCEFIKKHQAEVAQGE